MELLTSLILYKYHIDHILKPLPMCIAFGYLENHWIATIIPLLNLNICRSY